MPRSKIYTNDPRNSIRYNEANLQTREKLTRYYGSNHEIQEYLNHAIGLVHNLATYNAKVCTSATLRLYRVMQSGQSGRSSRLNARSIPDVKMKQIKAGHHGQKAASYAESGAEMVEITTHPVLDLLQSPNPILPGSLLEHLKWYLCWVGGNAYEYKSMNGGRPFMLSPLLAQYVSIEASVQNGIEAFNYGRSGEVSQLFNADEVIHYKLYPSTRSAVYGIGAAYGILPHADLIQDNLVHDISMAKNGMHPDGIWMLPESTSDPEAKKFEKILKAKFRGAKDFWKHLVFAGKVDFVSPQYPEKEMLSLPKQEHAEKIIRQAFGHTESMHDSTDTNVASALQSHDKQFLGGTIWPALQNDAAFKNAQLLPDFGLDPDEYLFAYDNPMERDEALYADRMRADVVSGIRTVNEARVELGMQEIKDNEFADKLMVNGQPLGAPPPGLGLMGPLAGSPSEPQETAPDESNAPTGEIPNEPTEAEGEGTATGRSIYSKRTPAEIIGDAIKSFKEPAHWQPCPFCADVKDGEEIAQSDDIAVHAMSSLGAGFEVIMLELLADAQEELVRALMNGESDEQVHQLEANLREQAQRVLGDEMIPIVELGGDEMAGSLSGTFQMSDQRAADFMREYTIELSNDIMGTTADIAKRAVQAGLEEGLTEDQVVSVMQENGIAENRARMIARTETQRAVQNGKRQAMIQNGVKKVEWVNAPGATRAHQMIAARSPKPIDEPFVEAGETLDKETFDRPIYVPPARPNCRCGLLPIYDDED